MTLALFIIKTKKIEIHMKISAFPASFLMLNSSYEEQMRMVRR
jgi:hypothetical protein